MPSHAALAVMRTAGGFLRSRPHVADVRKQYGLRVCQALNVARRALSSGSPGGKPPASEPDFETMGADELRSIVKQLWKQSAAEGRTTTQGSISAPAEVARVTKGAVSDFQEAVDGRKDITIVDLQKMRDNLVPITMCTAYDYPSAVHVDLAGIDVLLVGDSVGMVVLGFDTTLPVSFEEMLHHCRAVSRGCKRPLLVGDLPFGSYEVSAEEAQRNAYRLLKEGSMEAVKLEGADSGRLRTVEVLVRGGIAVMGHIGLTPQSYSTLGGFRAQGRHARQAVELVAQAKRLESAGVFAMVLECVPEEVAKEVTAAVSVPTIGIGAGPHTSGQVLVYHDLLGMMQHPHYAKFRAEVRSKAFPSSQYSPYKMAAGEKQLFEQLLAQHKAAEAAAASSSSQSCGTAAADSGDPIQVY